MSRCFVPDLVGYRIRTIAELQDGATLVGHWWMERSSFKLLAEQLSDRMFGAIFLIAVPFVRDRGWSSNDLQFPPGLCHYVYWLVPCGWPEVNLTDCHLEVSHSLSLACSGKIISYTEFPLHASPNYSQVIH